jgi:hypothetical protein
MATVLVLGAFGFYGARVVRRLQASGHRVLQGTRSGGAGEGIVRVDLGDPSTFDAFREAHYVLNCTDTVAAPPDAAMAHVLSHGGVWLEMGADAPTVERLLATPRPDSVGTVLLGVGVFPGLSTALARSVAEAGPPPSRLDLGIKLSPLSGAGPGNCALMAESLFVPATRIEDGVLRRGPTALGETVPLVYGGVPRGSVNLALPDTTLIHRATGVPNVASHMALVPWWLRFNFAALAWVCAVLRPLRGPLVRLLTVGLVVVRAWMLRGVETDLRIVAVADRGLPSEHSQELHFRDGQEATAQGALGAVNACVARGRLAPGLRGLAEEFTLLELTR